MKYERIERATFLERPNRFIAYARIAGKQETIHVKNTGRCAELLVPEAEIFVQESDNPERKTKWDLIGVRKGNRLINMDSQIPNKVVEEWLRAGNLFLEPVTVRPETTYGNSRFDFYVESGEKKAFIEVKGVTLEEDGVVRFPDAPSERAVKHMEELIRAKKEGYDAYVFLVIQMKGVRYFTPNMDTQPEFGEVLKKAKAAGVKILAYDCQVTEDSIKIDEEVPVVLEKPILWETVDPIVAWYRENKRDLPWRHDVTPYRVWVSEIMLQQTRVEAVKPYYDRFLKELPTITDLANAKEDRLMKLWEGLGYYNRVRNMQKAAIQMVEQYGGQFPESYEEIHALTGIGNYTAGAIGSFAFGIPKPAVDGNVLRVVSRILAIQKRPDKGLLAGLYELPNLEGWLSQQEVIEYSKSIGLSPIRIKKLPAAKHIFSHVEWQMKGYEIQVDELEKNCSKEMIFAKEEVLKEKYSIPSAFEAYCVWKQK